MAGRRYRFDLQVHTDRHSPCSRLPAEQLIGRAKKAGLDGLLLTDHDFLWSVEEVEALKREAGEAGIVVLRGAEVRTEREGVATGDLLLVGIERLPEGIRTIDQVCNEAHRQGGLVIAPHPFAAGRGIGEDIHSAAIDAIEVYNHRYRKHDPGKKGLRAWETSDLPGVAGSDAHSLSELGRCCTEFIDPIASEAELIEAIRAHRCRPLRHGPPRGWRRLFYRAEEMGEI